MRNSTKLLLLFLLLVACVASFARDPSQVRQFRKLNPCPATNSTRGPCPNYVVDHIIPLCLGGLDSPINMQWQSRSASLQKDKLEWEACRRMRKICPRP